MLPTELVCSWPSGRSRKQARRDRRSFESQNQDEYRMSDAIRLGKPLTCTARDAAVRPLPGGRNGASPSVALSLVIPVLPDAARTELSQATR